MIRTTVLSAILATIASFAGAEEHNCAEEIAQLQTGKSAVAKMHEVWFAPNRNWLKDEYPQAMVVSHEFGIESATNGSEFEQYQIAWETTGQAWYVAAETRLTGYTSSYNLMPLYLFDDGNECIVIAADWGLTPEDLPPEMEAMVK